MFDRPQHRRWVAATLFSLLAPGFLASQAPVPSPRALSVSAALGWAIGNNSASGIERAMRAGGYDDPTSCFLFCAGTIKHPFSTHDSPALAAMVRRKLRKNFEARAMVGVTDLGATFGFKASPFPGSYISLKQSVNSYALLLGLRPDSNSGFWIALGPAFHAVVLDRTDLPDAPTIEMSRVGAVVALGVEFPKKKRFFTEIQGQYRLVGTVTTPPIDVAGYDGAVVGTLPSTDVNFNHGMFSVGWGVRF